MPIPGRRTGRLSSIRGPPPKARRVPARPTEPPADGAKRCSHCGSTNLIRGEDDTTCGDCYVQISDDNIVSDLTFEENAGGRATVQGGTVADNSRHAKTLGAGAYRKVGGGERNTLADVQNAGRRALQNLCPKLGILEPVQLQAESIWTLAANINFSAGRKTDEVVSACLYAACRRQKQNRILLMDIAELLQINVFRLGEVYKDLCKELYLNNESVGHQYLQELEPLIKKYCDKLQFADKTKQVAEDALKIIRRMNRDWIVAGRHPAGLCGACIILAARMNNFQRSVREIVYVSKVADVTIAKRVEEFRRTKSSGLTVEQFRRYANRIKHQHDPPSLHLAEQRERLMQGRKRKRDEHIREQSTARDSRDPQSERVSPIDITDDNSGISSRLSSMETSTPASDDESERIDKQKRQRLEGTPLPPTPPLTQQQTESHTVHGNQSHTPLERPAISQGNNQDYHETRKRRRPDEEDANGMSVPAEDDHCIREPTEPPRPSSTARQKQALRFDSDGFAIPALPVPACSVSEESPPPSKRARTRRSEPPPVELSQEELDVENYLELEIEQALQDGEVEESRSEVEKANVEKRYQEELERAKLLAAEQRELDAEKMRARREAEGQRMWDLENEDLEKEFMDDPEVKWCLLDEEEVKIKERIWVAHNEDWLRKQAEKEMLAKVAKATSGSNRGRKRKDGGKEGKTHRKRSKMGDGTVLTESSTPIETPEDAARAMLEKRAPQKSQHVDFSMLQKIYGRESVSRANSSSPEDGSTATEAATPAENRETTATPAPSEQDNRVDFQEEADQAAGGSPVSPTRSAANANAVEEEQGNINWDNINGDPVDDDDDEDGEEGDYRRAAGYDQETDEFGVVPDDFEDESGDEYG